MVGVSTILTVCVTFLISMVLPIVVYIIYGVKNKGQGCLDRLVIRCSRLCHFSGDYKDTYFERTGGLGRLSDLCLSELCFVLSDAGIYGRTF